MSTFGSPISAIGSAAVLAGAALLLVRRRLLRTYAVNLPDVRAELTAVHTRYEAALAENDVAALDELFFDHPATLRYGPDKSQHGYAAIAAMRASKKQPQGPRSEVVSKTITTFGSDFGTACDFSETEVVDPAFVKDINGARQESLAQITMMVGLSFVWLFRHHKNLIHPNNLAWLTNLSRQCSII